MGVQNENNFEGSVFEKSLNFHSENKSTDEQLRELPKSNGEWQKYIDSDIVPTHPVYTGEKPIAELTQPSYSDEKSLAEIMIDRPSKPDYYLNLAAVIATRSTCIRRRYGAVIVKHDRVIATGYNGAPNKTPNCCDIGECYRETHNIPRFTRYECCKSVHAEMNAIINADPLRRKGATLYLVGLEKDGSFTDADCCSMCKRVVINSGISRVVFRTKDDNIRTVVVQEWIANEDSLVNV